MLEPWISTRSACWRSCWNVVAPPRPNEIPSPGTVDVSYPRLVLDLHDPERGVQLLEQVVLLVVERGAAEVGDRHRASRRAAVGQRLLPAVVARALDPIGDHVHRGLERQGLPRGAARTPVQHAVRAMRAGDQLHGRGALGTQATFGD